MKADDLKTLIMSLTQDIEFSYKDRMGSICPFSKENISVSFDGKFKEYDNIDDVMSDSFFDGKSLDEISEKLIIG